jgi:hypothetical protein
MTTTAPHNAHPTTPERVLGVAGALRAKTWKRGCTTGHGPKPRARPLAARPPERWLQEVAQAQRCCGLPETALVVRGYEAGRAGVWLQRFGPAPEITHAVVESFAIAVKRRKRRAQSEALEVRKGLRLLLR